MRFVKCRSLEYRSRSGRIGGLKKGEDGRKRCQSGSRDIFDDEQDLLDMYRAIVNHLGLTGNIGYSNDPEGMLESLKQSDPYPLMVVDNRYFGKILGIHFIRQCLEMGVPASAILFVSNDSDALPADLRERGVGLMGKYGNQMEAVEWVVDRQKVLKASQ